MYIKDIDSEVLISFYENLLINQGIKGRTVEIINSYLVSAFDIAKRKKQILENPTKDAIAEVKSEFDFSRKKRHSLSKAEEMKLLDKLADRFKLNKTQTILKALELLANQK